MVGCKFGPRSHLQPLVDARVVQDKHEIPAFETSFRCHCCHQLCIVGLFQAKELVEMLCLQLDLTLQDKFVNNLTRWSLEHAIELK